MGLEIWLCLLFVILQQHPFSHASTQVPCYFAFGDSYFDNGNNNNRLTTAKANFLPYGIDFPRGPTGRFSNGRNIADALAKILGFEYSSPPFAEAKDYQLLKGVTYASGSSGILEKDTRSVGAVINLPMQLQNHKITVKRLSRIFENNNVLATTYLSKCLYVVNSGINNYILNYFLTKNSATSLIYNPEQFAELLVRRYAFQLKTLYGYGARKIALFGTNQVGCYPLIRRKFGAKGLNCIEEVNNAVKLFNMKLVSAIEGLNRNLVGAKFVYINTYDIQAELSLSPGFKFKHQPCCETILNTGGACTPLSRPCLNRDDHVFCDGIHPSEALATGIAGRAYRAKLPTDAYPYDISRLITL